MTPQQQQFVLEYLIDLNATQAAIRAGYSEKTARQQASDLLTKPDIQDAVAEAMAARSKRTEITADRVLCELGKIGFSDLADVTDWGTKEVAIGFSEDGKRLRAEEIGEATVVKYVRAPFVEVVNRDDLAPEVRASVAEVALTKDGFKIKMHDKTAALTQIGRHLGMFVDRSEVTGRGGGPIETNEVSNADRAKAIVAILSKVKAEREGA